MIQLFKNNDDEKDRELRFLFLRVLFPANLREMDGQSLVGSIAIDRMNQSCDANCPPVQLLLESLYILYFQHIISKPHQALATIIDQRAGSSQGTMVHVESTGESASDRDQHPPKPTSRVSPEMKRRRDN